MIGVAGEHADRWTTTTTAQSFLLTLCLSRISIGELYLGMFTVESILESESPLMFSCFNLAFETLGVKTSSGLKIKLRFLCHLNQG